MSAPSPFPPVPLDLSSFVGREAELRRAAEALSGARLLTLTGPGGSGKTRLARELARRRSGEQPVLWVELADVLPSGDPLRAVVQRLGQAMDAGSDAAGLAELVAELPPETLVAFDNCEHLLDAAATVAEVVLRRHVGARILATSREPLGLPGERAWLVPPLSVEGEGEAVRLFVERAREAQPDFELGDGNREAVHALCRALDGIPLAIELAAARTRVMTPAQIHGRLHDALDLLSRGGRTAVPRHRTLRATLDWSHDLLEAPCARLLRRLAVFQGGASLEGVEAVGGDAGDDPLDTLESLSRLVDRSWVTVRETDGVARYHLLETVRIYAGERLEAAEESQETQARHAAFVVALVEQARPHFTGPGRRAWVERLTPELPNLRGALAWSLTHDPALHLRLAASLWWFWFSSRHWDEARRWLEGAVSLPEASARDKRRAELLFALGALDALQGRSAAARPWLDEALEIATALNEDSLAAYVRVYLGMSLAQVLDPEAERHLEPARDWLATHGDLYLLRLAQILLGSAYSNRGDVAAALDVTRAGVETARAFGQDRELGISLQALGILLFQAGVLDEARARLLESLAALERDPSIMFVARTLHFLALCEARSGAPATAVRWLAAAEGGRSGIGVSVVAIDAGPSAPVVAELREGLGEAAFAAAWSEGAAAELADVVREVLRGGRMPAPAPAVVPAPAPTPGTPDGAAPDAPAPDLWVGLLGTFEVEVEGRRVPDEQWPYARPKELLALLALHPEGRTRDQIAAAMWPESGPTQARNSVHVTLHHLRKALGRPDWIALDDGFYRLASSVRVEVDALRFEAVATDPAAGLERLRAAMAWYRGDLLAGEVSGRWVEERADGLRRLRRDAGLRLGLALEAAGDDEAADGLYAALILTEELDEELHRRLMTVRSRRGDLEGARKVFERLERTLREMGATPEAATADLLRPVSLAGS